MMKCRWCGAVLRFDPGRGWVHPGGGLYVWRCDRCKATGDGYPTPATCPQCGGATRDDHVALPVRDGTG